MSRLLMTVLCLFAAVVPAAAQEALTRERVSFAIEATDQRIEKARLLSANVETARAEDEVRIAMDFQTRAREALGRDALDIAMRLTLEARRHADRAIALARGLPDPDRVQAQLERTQDLLRRSRDRVEECESDRARIMMRTAVEMQMRADAAFQSSRFLAALQLTTGARDRGLRALRLCRIEENVQESVERALQRTDEVIARAERALKDKSSDAARSALSRAVALQSRAQNDFNRGDHESSVQLTQSARAAAFQALRLAGGKP